MKVLVETLNYKHSYHFVPNYSHYNFIAIIKSEYVQRKLFS